MNIEGVFGLAFVLLLWWFAMTWVLSSFFHNRRAKKWAAFRDDAKTWAEQHLENTEHQLVAVELVLMLREHADQSFEISELNLDQPIADQVFVLSNDFSSTQLAAKRYFNTKSPKITTDLKLRDWISWFADSAKQS